MGWIRLAPGDRRAPQAGLDCSETASPPLSQTLWPVHRQPPLHAADLGLHCCVPVGPDRVPGSPGVDDPPTRSANGIGHRREHRPQQHDANGRNGRVWLHGGAVDGAPRQHHQSKPAAMGPTDRSGHWETNCESSRSSGQLVQSCWQILHQMEKLLEPHQLDRLRYAGVPHKQKRPFGIRALFGQLHQGPEAG